MEMQSKHNNGTSYKWIYKVAAGIAACLVLCGGILGIRAAVKGQAPTLNNGDKVVSAENTVVKGIESYDELYTLLSAKRDGGGEKGTFTTEAVSEDEAAPAEPEAPMAAPVPEPTAPAGEATKNYAATDSAAGEKDYSRTNTQVDSVDEADIVKTDGDYIYTLSWSQNKLYIVKVDGSELSVASSIRFREEVENEWWNAREFYVSGDRLLLISSCNRYATTSDKDGYDNYTDNTCVTVYDISDRSRVTELSRLEQSGNYSDSRMVNGYLYLISSYYTYQWIKDRPITYCPAVTVNGEQELLEPTDIIVYEEPEDTAYTVITSIDAKSGTEFSSQKALFGSTGTMYCSNEHILLASSQYHDLSEQGLIDEDGKNYVIQGGESGTKLVLFEYGDGVVNQTASTEIKGHLLNQFSMDEYNGFFRIVVTRDSWSQIIYTDGIDTYGDWNNASDNALYVLDAGLNEVGSVENLGEDERVYSVRFDGEVGYFVTFRQTDPLFTVDLSDPYNPTVLSALKIPGFSSYMHHFGEGLLLGIGYDADEQTGWTNCIKLSMFDVSDKTNVTEAHKLLLDEVYWSEATYNHKAILVNAEKNLIAFPAEDTYYVYSFDPTAGFTLEGKVRFTDEKDFYYSNMRGLYIDNFFFVVSENHIIVLDLSTFEKLQTLTLD